MCHCHFYPFLMVRVSLSIVQPGTRESHLKRQELHRPSVIHRRGRHEKWGEEKWQARNQTSLDSNLKNRFISLRRSRTFRSIFAISIDEPSIFSSLKGTSRPLISQLTNQSIFQATYEVFSLVAADKRHMNGSHLVSASRSKTLVTTNELINSWWYI